MIHTHPTLGDVAIAPLLAAGKRGGVVPCQFNGHGQSDLALVLVTDICRISNIGNGGLVR